LEFEMNEAGNKMIWQKQIRASWVVWTGKLSLIFARIMWYVICMWNWERRSMWWIMIVSPCFFNNSAGSFEKSCESNFFKFCHIW
jgi:hypothetical protein